MVTFMAQAVRAKLHGMNNIHRVTSDPDGPQPTRSTPISSETGHIQFQTWLLGNIYMVALNSEPISLHIYAVQRSAAVVVHGTVPKFHPVPRALRRVRFTGLCASGVPDTTVRVTCHLSSPACCLRGHRRHVTGYNLVLRRKPIHPPSGSLSRRAHPALLAPVQPLVHEAVAPHDVTAVRKRAPRHLGPNKELE